MNDFKYQKKNKISDEKIMSYKDFGSVLEKHRVISRSYANVWKWSISSTLVLGVAITGWTLLNNNQVEAPISSPIIINERNIDFAPVNAITSIELQKTDEIESEERVIETIIATEIKQTTVKNTPVVQKEHKIKINSESETKLVLETDTLSINTLKAKEPNVWYSVNELPEKEKINLPTLYVAKLPWPGELTKSELTKHPVINTIYKSIGREVPIVDGRVFITEINAEEPTDFYRLTNNNFSPALIRDIHTAADNSALLIKDLTLFIPGKGRVNMGDKLIMIKSDKKFEKRFAE